VVINNYRLAPEFKVMNMASDCAATVKWVAENIHEYNGNEDRIFISGHSAGGHLASLISLNPEFFTNLGIDNPIKGVILIDAFGLNAKDFIEAHQNIYLNHITNIFTDNPENWERCSPAEHLENTNFPVYILTGSKTHDVLMYDNKIFAQKLEEMNIPHVHKIFEGKTHIQMIKQLEDSDSEIYEEIMKLVAGSW
jgi:acetyl esterase/lipase